MNAKQQHIRNVLCRRWQQGFTRLNTLAVFSESPYEETKKSLWVKKYVTSNFEQWFL